MASSYVNAPSDTSFVKTLSKNDTCDIYVDYNMRAILYVISGTSTGNGLYFVTSNSNNSSLSASTRGLVHIKAVLDATDVALTASQNNIHVVSSCATQVSLYVKYLYSANSFVPPHIQTLV